MANERTEANLHFRFHDSCKHTPSFIAKSTFFYVQSAGHFRSAADYYTRREGYKSILLLYTVNGKGYANYRGKHYELGQKQVLLIDCEEYQEYYTDKLDLWEIKWIHFHGSGSNSYFKLIYDNYGPVITLNESNQIPVYIDQIMEMIKNSDRQQEVKSSCLIMQMLTEMILVGSQSPGNPKNNLQYRQVEAAFDFIAENYTRRITLEEIAAIANCSVYHFIRIFKKATGYSPYEYLIKYRINQAKLLLTSSMESVELIAEQTGFESTSNFIKTFKEIEGLTPLKYRKFWIN